MANVSTELCYALEYLIASMSRMKEIVVRFFEVQLSSSAKWKHETTWWHVKLQSLTCHHVVDLSTSQHTTQSGSL